MTWESINFFHTIVYCIIIDMNYYYLIGFFFFLICFVFSVYFCFKFKDSRLLSLKEIDEYKKKHGKKPSYWLQYRFMLNILLAVIFLLLTIAFLLMVFGIPMKNSENLIS